MDKENEDVMLVRDILARELETINNYQKQLLSAKDPHVIAFISHVIDEEKEHVAEAIELINQMDERQAIRFAGSSHWRQSVTSESVPGLDANGSTPIRTEPQAARLTVGSLRSRDKP